MIYVIIILIALGLGLNKLSEKYGFHKLNYARSLSKSVVEKDEELEIITVVENKKILPITFLKIIEKFSPEIKFIQSTDVIEGGDGIYHTYAITLMPYQRVRRRYKISCSKRGRYVIFESTLNLGDMLGINTFSKGISQYNEFIVLPEKYDISSNLTSFGNYCGDISVRRWIVEDPILTIGIREYTGFEPQKNIHWPSSLKNGRLMVKNFDYTTDNRGMVILNIETNKPFWSKIEDKKIEKCISISRTVVEEFEENGVQYGFITDAQASGNFQNKINIPPGWGNGHLFTILECLGRIDYGISSEFEECLDSILRRNETHSTYVIITPTVLDEYIPYINSLSKMCERLILISLDEKNLDKLHEGILSYVEGRD